jgi:hypothetical protein
MRLWAACISLSCCTAALAEPLSVRNLNPLLSSYELPPALSSTSPGTAVLSAEFAISNTSLDQSSAHESLQLDGELQRWQLSFAQPINESLGIRVEVPYVRLSGGGLDNFIESFHKTFGMPNGNRNVVPTNRLLIQHTRNGVTDVDAVNSSSGIGDVTLRLSKQLGSRDTDTKFNNTLWLSVKLPTGNADKFTGSGSTDVALSFAASQQLSPRFVTQQQLSLSVLGNGDRLTDQQKRVVWSGSLGIDASVTQHWGAVLQLDGNTRVFASEIRVLGPALQLSVGPRYQAEHWRGSLIISEDIAVDTAPDVQFQLALTRKY